jgi:arylsulfatase A
VRLPLVARWSGTISANTECRLPAMTIDVLPTVAKIVAAELPKHPIEVKDLGPLRNEANARSLHDAYYHYYNTGELQAVRSGKWKLMLPHTYGTMEGQEPGKDGTQGR